MAIKKIRMRPEGTNDYGDILHPETSANVVKFADGSTVEAHKADIVHVPFAIASGTNSYAVNISDIKTLVEGMSVKIKFASANTGACTLNINGLGAKTIAKSNGSVLSSGNIKANQIVHLAYNGTSFQLLGEGGEYGTAQASDVLAPKTVGTESGIITGTMVNRGAPAQTLTTQGGQYNIPPGYFSGGSVKAQFANLTPSNIKNGVNVGGVVGTFVESFSFKREPFGYFNASRINKTNPVNKTVNFTTTAKGFVVIDWGTIVINSNPVVLGSETVPTSGNITTKTKTGVVGSLTYTVTLYSNRFTLIVTSGSDANASVSYNNAYVTVHH